MNFKDIHPAYIFIFAIIVVFLINSFGKIKEHVMNLEPNANAAEACKTISSKADEIAAHYKGAKEIVDAAWGFMSPNNYKSGDNTTNNEMRNIINTNLSNNDIMKISNDCKNSTAGYQLNELDATQCPFCQKNGCDMTNITQENIAKSDQQCAMQSAIETLMTKTNSVDAQALAETLQKAQGVLSGDNTSTNKNCNIVSTDMSSNQYMEQLGKCANEASIKQENRVKACGAVSNVIQKNAFDNIQKCMIGTTIKSTSDTSSQSKLASVFKTTQESTGIDPAASLGSSIASFSSCICCCIVLLGLGYVGYSSTEEGDSGSGFSSGSGSGLSKLSKLSK
jgi:hypothetical protein